ncbi:hypothetical protein [Pseudomonas mosselii]|uniref:hypothetical protein n=1 Tax=Pseudomonas mosselii TaxID=78327 RepID=UPI001645118D|nr:hypothetical protein [Pseudomonas mosselii]MBC3456762.1 hypothetical protein [Pseudomonas mosselii]MCL8302601.1 hypothetical protein [Pseudomonas mosselii]MCL8343037.1 hypothetical protein [Pseudomonas mosselii]MCU9532023.1 hypothetical protein [Pseudomonas mosselii]MCU9539552.1 hypothetical protein [Pseudomonas mosselii]
MKKIVPDPPRLAPFIAIRPTLTREEAMAAAVEVATAISDVLDIYFKTDPGEAQDRLFAASDYLGQLACALLEHKPQVQP